MTRRARERDGDDEVRIDMTPMIDCVFQLLIFFLCTLNFVPLEGQLSSELPRNEGLGSTPAVPLEDMKIVISYDAATRRATYRAGSARTAERAELLAAVRRFVLTSPGRAVEISPDPRVPYRCVVLALDVASEARASNIRFSGLAGTIER